MPHIRPIVTGTTTRRLSVLVQVEQFHIRDPQEAITKITKTLFDMAKYSCLKNKSINGKFTFSYMPKLSLTINTSVQYLTLYNYCPRFCSLGDTSFDPCPNLFFPNRYLGTETHGSKGGSLQFSSRLQVTNTVLE